VRNPLYIGNILLYVGVGVMSQAVWPWLPLVALVWFVVQYHLIVSREEEFLAKEFGEPYAEYRANVPRFFVRLVPWMHASQAGQRPSWPDAIRSERRTLQAIVLVTAVLFLIEWWT
ncbi:MAG: methyltransferase, partial [Bacteroidota bacterium]